MSKIQVRERAGACLHCGHTDHDSDPFDYHRRPPHAAWVWLAGLLTFACGWGGPAAMLWGLVVERTGGGPWVLRAGFVLFVMHVPSMCWACRLVEWRDRPGSEPD